MKYFETEFLILPYSSDASDVLAAMAGEIGYETFEDIPNGLKGYIQQQLFDSTTVQSMIDEFPFVDVKVEYKNQEAEYKDWNEQWEQEGFDPIYVSNDIVIHDGRHLPEVVPAIPIEIDAHLAFGTGTHETTRMICATLQSLPLLGKRVLDCGTGTGILSICALKLGAHEAVGYDIDEWSVENAKHNAIINNVDIHFNALLGDANILNKVEGGFDLIVANINRNILLADMPIFYQKLNSRATLILSGFYLNDCDLLINRAEEIGLELEDQKTDNDWACLVLRNKS